MKIITINIPDQYLDAIQGFVDLGFFQSRSDFVRDAIKDFLMNHKGLGDNLNADKVYELFKDVNVKEIRGFDDGETKK